MGKSFAWMVLFDLRRNKHLCFHGDPTNIHPRTSRPHRRGRGGGTLCRPQKRRRQLHGALPLPRREISFFFGQSDQTVFPLFWLRQKRKCHRLFDGPRRHELCRSRQRLSPKRRHASARRGRLPPRPRTRRPGAPKANHTDRSFRKSGRSLSQTAQIFPASHRVFQKPGIERRDRQTVWLGLRPGRMAKLG